MNKKVGIAIGVAIVLVIIGVVLVSRSNKEDTQQEQNTSFTRPAPEQANNEQPTTTPAEPDVNNLEFTLVDSRIECSSPDQCSGSIRVAPKAVADTTDVGLYRVNPQTKLIQNGGEQNLSTLPTAGDPNTVFRLTLVPGSADTLQQISY